jgi:hypothetical protein
MRQENSVLFALRDLRSLESERVAERERIETERQRAAAEQRRAEETQKAADARQRQHEQQERDSLARALDQASGRNEQLESDVQTLRALVSAVRPELVDRRLWPFALAAAAAVALAIVLVASQRPVIRERVVYVPTPATSISPPSTPPLPALVSSPEPPPRPSPPHPRPRLKKRVVTPPALALPTVQDCGGKDPLCGTNL